MSDKLQPLPQAALTAARLRRIAHEMLLEAEALEAETGLQRQSPSQCVEFKYSRNKRSKQTMKNRYEPR